MQALIAPLKELAEYDEIRKVTRQGKGTVALSGCVELPETSYDLRTQRWPEIQGHRYL